MSEDRVEFRNSSGNLLVGILMDSTSADTVILCHGFASHKNGFHCPAIASALQEKGLSSLRIDFTGNGESEGTFKFANYKQEAADIDAARKYLESIGKRPLGLMGHSKAGSGAVIYAALYGKIPRVANVSGRFEHKHGVKRRFGEDVFKKVDKEGGKMVGFTVEGGVKKEAFLDREDLKERMTLDMTEVCGKIPSHVRVITVHGHEDETIPVRDAHSFAELLPGKQLKVVSGADHNFSQKEHTDQLIAVLLEFFTAS